MIPLPRPPVAPTLSWRLADADCVLNFCTEFSTETFGHIWLSVDGGARVEATISRFVRIHTDSDSRHTVKVIYKSAVEQQHRWHQPLVGSSRSSAMKPTAPRRSSRTIGKRLSLSATRSPRACSSTPTAVSTPDDQYDRPWQDDATGTYAFLTAEALGLRPYIMGLRRGRYDEIGLRRSAESRARISV